ncbi:MAG TPA: mevalonate kinase [Polyangiaceae bacterium]
MTHARASGKVILLGEHAVVYGVPALAVGLDRGVEVEAVPAASASIVLGEHTARAGDGSDTARALEALLRALDARPVALSTRLELPAGSGLGVSAALGVAVARAVLGATRESPPAVRERVLAGAAAWEGVFHGDASGIDAAVAERGGCVQFKRGSGIEEVELGRPLPLVVAVAGPPASTKLMVSEVARLRERRPAVVDKAFEGIRALVNNARLCLEAGDLPGLGKLMDLNQMLLAGLMLSTEGIERTCDIARKAGALGAKLTGAGGGGAVVALADLDPEPLLAAFRSEGVECFSATVGGKAP